MTRAEERFFEIIEEIKEMRERKGADYGSAEDSFANVRASSAWGVPPWIGVMVRMGDKFTRLQSLVRNGKLANESAEDSIRDIAVYAIIALILFEEERDTRAT